MPFCRFCRALNMRRKNSCVYANPTIPVSNTRLCYFFYQQKCKIKKVKHRPSTKYLGPVVQSVVSLTSSLRVISLTVLADSIYNILVFFAEKM